MENNKIFAKVSNFTLEQTISVYNKNHMLETVKVPINGVREGIECLRRKYDVKKIVLMGNKDYLQRYKEELTSFYFDKHEIKIEIVERI